MENSGETIAAIMAPIELPYTHYEQSMVSVIHHFYLSKVLGAPHEYVDMVHKIHTASDRDIIYIHLNTVGGQLSTGIQIINAMQGSQAHIIASVESEAHSLGTLIFLAADEFVIHDNCFMMFHNFSGGVVGKGHEQLAELDATLRWFKKLVDKLYRPFLTSKEIKRMIKDEDIWLHSDEIRKRVTAMVKEKQAQHDAELENINENLNEMVP